MPRPVQKRFKSWSYSRLVEWEQCPFRAAKKHLEKVKEPEGPALARGRSIEAAVYDYVFKKRKDLPAEGQTFADELAALRKICRSVMSNRELAVDRDWRPCAWDDWTNAWLRVKMDLLWASSRDDAFTLPKKGDLVVARAADLKTGRVYEDKVDQVDLYKLVALLLPPGLMAPTDISLGQLWYLDQGVTRPPDSWSCLVRSQATKAMKVWEKRVKPMLLDEAFIPRPGNHCKYCHLSKTKGGPCPY